MRNVAGDFPILKRRIRNRRLVYLDSAATAQKPATVVDAVAEFSSMHNANVHRGIHALSEEATAVFENGRAVVASFIGSSDWREIIFVRGATEGINLVASAWGRVNIAAGDEIIVSVMEHHSNFVPWQQLAVEKKAKLVVVDTTREGLLDISDLKKKLSRRTKVVALTHASNFIGTINPIADVSRMLMRRYGAHKKPIFVVDGAQSVPHMPVNVGSLGCDFFSFSGHKIYAPMGIGILWGKRGLLEAMAPYQTGGHMIKEVYSDRVAWNDVPWKFEAGTPHVEGVAGLVAAIAYCRKFSMPALRRHEKEITAYALRKLKALPFIEIYGPRDASKRTGLVAFNMKGVHAHDVSSALDGYGIAIRAGHHCAMPMHTKLALDASCRASFAIYTTKKDIDALVDALDGIYRKFSI